MNGRAHLLGNLIVAAAGAIIVLDKAPDLLVPAMTGFALGIVANPDVRDQAQVRNEGEWVVTRILGRPIGRLWTAFWWPLAALLPHRHALSHLPLLGTLVAAAYLLIPVAALYHYFSESQVGLTEFVVDLISQPIVVHIYLAWAAQDLLHWIQDL